MKVFTILLFKLHLFILLMAFIVVKTAGSLEDFLTLLNAIPEDGLEGRNM
jgi:hypothetical protein